MAGIAHLDDLPIDDLLDFMTALPSLKFTEKFDGSNMWFGVDEDGFFASREGKRPGSERVRSSSDWLEVSSNDQFRAATAALEEFKKDIERELTPGTTINVEVMFGPIPNSTDYGTSKNVIVMLGVVEGDAPSASKLFKKLSGKEATVTSTRISSTDGERLSKGFVHGRWSFVVAEEKPLPVRLRYVAKESLDQLKAYLDTKNDVASNVLGGKKTNGDVARVNLTSVPAAKRQGISTEREAVITHVRTKIVAGLKKALVDGLTKGTISQVSGRAVDVEGVVFKHGDVSVKVVDREAFTKRNGKFQQARARVNGAVMTVTGDEESRGGVIGEMRARLAALFGDPNLARTWSAKKVFSGFDSSNAVAAAQAFAKQFDRVDFQALKRKCASVVDSTMESVREESKKVLANDDELPKTVVDRTLASHAENLSGLKELRRSIDRSDNVLGLVLIVFERSLEKLASTPGLNEKKSKRDDSQVGKRLAHKSAHGMQMAYVATLFAQLFLLRVGNKDAKRIAKDSVGSKLLAPTKEQSPLNFWGTVVLHPDRAQGIIPPEEFRQMKRDAGRVLSTRIRSIHRTIGVTDVIDWAEQRANMRVIALRFADGSKDINIIRHGIYEWTDLTLSEQEVVASKIMLLLMRHDGDSQLMSPLRKAVDEVLLRARETAGSKGGKMTGKSIEEVPELMEDEGGEAGGAASFPLVASVATGSGDVAPVPKRLFKNRVMLRRVRRYGVEPKFARKVKK